MLSNYENKSTHWKGPLGRAYQYNTNEALSNNTFTNHEKINFKISFL